MLYAVPVWSCCSKTNLSSLEKIQNKVLRIIGKAEPTDSNKEMREKLNIQALEDVIYEHTQNFYEHQVKDVEILKNLGEYDEDNAPFKIKHKLPHQILMDKKTDK